EHTPPRRVDLCHVGRRFSPVVSWPRHSSSAIPAGQAAAVTFVKWNVGTPTTSRSARGPAADGRSTRSESCAGNRASGTVQGEAADLRKGRFQALPGPGLPRLSLKNLELNPSPPGSFRRFSEFDVKFTGCARPFTG